MDTKNPRYTKTLEKKQLALWKRIFNVQAPYRWNLRHLKPGFTLDIGCGIGRNLSNLDGNGIGIDHNYESVKMARKRGFSAYTPVEFKISEFNHVEIFDSLLLAHVAEHMNYEDVVGLLRNYLPNLKGRGKVILITPQEAGFKSDLTHVRFVDFLELRKITKKLNLKTQDEYSFPFPRLLGHIFLYNEFVSVSLKKL